MVLPNYSANYSNTFNQYLTFNAERDIFIIRNSNTILSTMVCPKCGGRLVFDEYTTDELMACCPNDDYKSNITIKGLIMLLNNNGLNLLATPPKPYKVTEETKPCEDDPSPDGFKIEQPE